MILNKFFSLLACSLFIQYGHAQSISDSTDLNDLPDSSITRLNSVVVVGKNAIISKLPGSASRLMYSEIRNQIPVSANEVFRKMAGLHVVDEEGAGMRVNIGVRGLDPDRSRGVLVLEDGIPVSLNPYGEPEMYYSPVIDRMIGVEVLKGSGQIVYGPQTIGGVINYLTANPTSRPTYKVKIGSGSGGLASVLLSYSNTFKNAGIVTTLLHKRADKLGYASFGITDFTTKFTMKTGVKSNLMIKLGVYNEISNSTYIGLTQTMYDQGGQDFELMAPDDILSVRRYSLSAHHSLDISKRLKLTTTAYGYTVTRNWRRQDFSSSKTTSNKTGVIWGDTSVPNGAVYMRNQNAHRNRQFEVAALESKLTYQYNLFKMKSELNTGIRYLYERAYEQRLNGKKADAASGDMVEDEIRTGNAISAYANNSLNISKRLLLTAGLRVENYAYERNILRNSFTINSVTKVIDTNLMATNHIFSVIPGLGLNFQMNEDMTVFSGVHKGYAPPRIKDAISNSGEVYQLEAEQSTNFELGVRGKIRKVLHYEVTAFHMDFTNQIIPVSESSGGTGAGLVNGGATIHQGIESALKLDLSQLFHSKTKYVLQGAMTFVNAEFKGDRFVKSGTETINVDGKATPYAPKYFHNASFNVELPFGLGFLFNANFVGQQYTDALNTVTPSPDGRNGLISAYQVFDLNVYAKIPKYGMYVNFGIKNLTDERYITSKRPQGIRLGLPRYFIGSLQFDL